MKKILTISEPDCGGKPTGYAVEIPNDNRDTIKAEVRKGLVKGWYYTDGMAESAASDAELDAVKENGYGWLGERFLVEVTTLDEVMLTAIHPFRKMHVTAKVDWDSYDEGDTPPDNIFKVTFTPAELSECANVLDTSRSDWWYLDERKFDEYMGEYVTNYTDFCHKGLVYVFVTE